MIRTPDQRLRVFISSTLNDLLEERSAARRAVESLKLTPVMFEAGARPHPRRRSIAPIWSRAMSSSAFTGAVMAGSLRGWTYPGSRMNFCCQKESRD